jgi:hypothetical protein
MKLKCFDENMGECQNWHHRYTNGNMACLACGVFDWKIRKWSGGYHEALKLISKEPKKKSILASLPKEVLDSILGDNE